MVNPPATLLTLPFEIRSSILYLALADTPLITAPEPPYTRSLDLSLLRTNRQIYHEARSIPITLHYFGKEYDTSVNFLSSLRLLPFQVAALKTLVIEYLKPGDLANFLALGSDNGYLFGEKTLDLNLLVIYADDWIANTARGWRSAASPEDVHYNLPRSSRWLRALCGLKGWKILEVAFKSGDLVSEYWKRGGFMQSLFDDFRSHSEDMDDDFTIWHAFQDVPVEKITVMRTKELGRIKQSHWGKEDVRRFMEGRECIVSKSLEPMEEEGPRPAFHIQERCWGPTMRKDHCKRCSPGCQPDCKDFLARQ